MVLARNGCLGAADDVAFWAVVIILIGSAVRPVATSAQRDEASPIRILDERLAHGEIDSENYVERRRVLEGRW